MTFVSALAFGQRSTHYTTLDHIITTANEEGRNLNLQHHLSFINNQNSNMYCVTKSAFILIPQNFISLEYTSMCTEIRLKMHCPNRLLKLNWYMFIYTDYSGFTEATHSHLYLILIHLRGAWENLFTSLFKSKITSKTNTNQQVRSATWCSPIKNTAEGTNWTDHKDNTVYLQESHFR